MATDLLGPLMAAVLAEALAALTEPVGRVSLYPGADVAWDDCCEGQLWVRVAETTPTGSGPQAGTRQPCGVHLWQVLLGIGVMRCAAVVKDDGTPPTPAELTADTLAMTQDRADIEEAIKCGVAPLTEQMHFVRWDPLGPQGGCVGGEWLFFVKMGTCSCP